MADSGIPKKDTKGNDIVPHITKPAVKSEEIKDSAFKKAAKVFFSEDIDHVTDSVMDDFVKPRAKSFGLDLIKKVKEFLYDSITDFAGSIFFGKSSSGGYTYNKNGSKYTSYSKYSSPYSGYGDPDEYYWSNGTYYKGSQQPKETIRHDIVRERLIKDAGEAQKVIDDLRYIIRTSKEHYAYVGDYYADVGAPVDKMDYEFIWINNMLDNCKPRYVGKGYVLDLPKPIPRP